MKEFIKLTKIMKRLRSPITGCPWDRKQKPESLREYVLEEAHELVEAIDLNSLQKQKEELGDLLLQIVFLSRIHEEKGNFSIADVLDTINSKLIKRHPHIFGDVTVNSAEEVKRNWEAIKQKEKKAASILSDYPTHMPALSHAKRVADQASGVGFDWQDPLLALDKVEEEIHELRKEIETGDPRRIEEELGDILFAIANVARLVKINPEFALKTTNRKFIRRFRYIEQQLLNQGKDIAQTNLDEMEILWNEAKIKE